MKAFLIILASVFMKPTDMKALPIILVILASVFLILGILYFTGDWLFSKKEKEKYNIKRQRLVCGILWILNAACLLFMLYDSFFGIIILCWINSVALILNYFWTKDENSWLRKKDSDF